MDYDNDGITDFISGSYDPGSVYLFRGEGDGKYAAVETLLDETGAELVHHPVEFREWKAITDPIARNDDKGIGLRVASFGSWPATVDWDSDGDLDMLIGSFSGELVLRTNTGTRSAPVWNATSSVIEAAGKPINVRMHAAPAVADWDHDGLWDIVLGAGDGSVGWIRNIGTAAAPTFEDIRSLVTSASDNKFLEQLLKPEQTPIHGTRAQICVTDYNDDGRLDLILGDYSDIARLPSLSDSKLAAFEQLQQQRAELLSTGNRLRKKFTDDWKNEQFTTERERFNEVFQELEKERTSYFAENRRASFVWLFLRQDAASETKDDSAPADAAERDPAAAHSSPAEPAMATNSPDSNSFATKSEGTAKTAQLEMTALAEPVEESDSEFDVTVSILIEKGWHLYDAVPDGGIHRPVSIELIGPETVVQPGDWKRPKGIPDLGNPRETIYANLVTFTRRIRLADQSKPTRITVVANYEVCTDSYCLPPGQLRLSLDLTE